MRAQIGVDRQAFSDADGTETFTPLRLKITGEGPGDAPPKYTNLTIALGSHWPQRLAHAAEDTFKASFRGGTVCSQRLSAAEGALRQVIQPRIQRTGINV